MVQVDVQAKVDRVVVIKGELTVAVAKVEVEMEMKVSD